MTESDFDHDEYDSFHDEVELVGVGLSEAKELDVKINRVFPGVVVRKDLVQAVKGNAVVPSYVLEYLLGQYAATDEEELIAEATQTVKDILAEHYVNRNEHKKIKSLIREKGTFRIIDRVTVTLNEKDDHYEASFENLQLDGVIIDSGTVNKNQKLLVGGVWSICDLEWFHEDSPKVSPYKLIHLKPIQIADVNFEDYFSGRERFSTDEWIDLLMQSIGLNPALFSKRGKLIALTRLIPFVERNYNLVELGPKGTGKSHIYSEFSPNGILISGGEITLAKLFVNNSNNRIGLVGYWDCVAFDEFASSKGDKNLVNVMKNYLANKTFSRGTTTMGAEASMVFIGNTKRTVAEMLRVSHLFDELPDAYCDTAWLDRIHFYIPGWEVAPIRNEMFTSGYGFVVDYLAEVLRSKRSEDFSNKYKDYFNLDSSISTRDLDGINKTFSGLMKIIHPNGEASEEDIRELLEFSIEGRKRVKDQILRIDTTMRENPPRFVYSDKLGNETDIKTLEQIKYPALYDRPWDENPVEENSEVPGESFVSFGGAGEGRASVTVAPPLPIPADVVHVDATAEGGPALYEGHLDFVSGQTGVSYENLILPWILGASEITIIDPYIRLPHQGRNLADLLSLLAVAKDPIEHIQVKLVTMEEPTKEYKLKHLQMLSNLKDAAEPLDITLTFEFETDIHDRRIETNHGWRIDLGKGLDIWTPPSNNPLDFSKTRQELRQVKQSFSVHYIRLN